MATSMLTVEIDAAPAEVWAVLADFGNIYTWNPGVKASHLTSDQTEGTGTARHCDLAPIGGVEEHVSTWEPERQMVIQLRGTGATPITTGQVTFALTPLDDGLRTRVALTAQYVPRFGALGPALDSIMLRRRLLQGFRGLLAGLKHRVETGATDTPTPRLPIDSVIVA